jgi:hypothetical protein
MINSHIISAKVQAWIQKTPPPKGAVFCYTFVLLKNAKPGAQSTSFPGWIENQKYEKKSGYDPPYENKQFMQYVKTCASTLINKISD